MSAPMRSSLPAGSAMSQQYGRLMGDYLLANNLHLLALHLADTLSQPMVCGKELRKNCWLQTVYCGTSLIQKVQSRPKKIQKFGGGAEFCRAVGAISCTGVGPGRISHRDVASVKNVMYT